MDSDKIRKFLKLAGQKLGTDAREASPEIRKLGAQLLLSETLEYVIKGLGVVPEFKGNPITDANGLDYVSKNPPDRLEMLDGLSDVAYTMYWNSEAFGLNLEKAFDAVCDNNLEKFVKLESSNALINREGPLEREEWNCAIDIKWPEEVVSVEIIRVDESVYAVGKDKHGKVRKPSSYVSVDLKKFL
jgi:hypothetical protein